MHNNRVTKTVEVPIELAIRVKRNASTVAKKKLIAKRKTQRLARQGNQK